MTYYKFQDIDNTVDKILSAFGEYIYVYFKANPESDYLDTNFTRKFKEFEEEDYVYRNMYVMYIEELLFSMNPNKSKQEIIAAWLKHIEKSFNILRNLPYELEKKYELNNGDYQEAAWAVANEYNNLTERNMFVLIEEGESTLRYALMSVLELENYRKDKQADRIMGYGAIIESLISDQDQQAGEAGNIDYIINYISSMIERINKNLKI